MNNILPQNLASETLLYRHMCQVDEIRFAASTSQRLHCNSSNRTLTSNEIVIENWIVLNEHYLYENLVKGAFWKALVVGGG